jgi:hypothetical protein
MLSDWVAIYCSFVILIVALRVVKQIMFWGGF